MNLINFTYKGHISVKNRKKYMSIRIPMTRKLIYIISLIVVTIAWCLGLFLLIGIFLKLNLFIYKLILFFVFLIWSSIGLIGVSFFMWMFFGRERIIISKEYLVTEKPLIFFYRRNIYSIKDISNIKIDKEVFKINRNGNWIEDKRTVLKFDTPNKQVIFARNISDIDAEFVLLNLAKCTFLEHEQFATLM